jgi:hypothetical protein
MGHSDQSLERAMSQLPKVMLLSWSLPPGISGSCTVVQNLAMQFRSHEMVVVGAYWVGFAPVSWRPGWPALLYISVQPPFHWRGGRWIRWAQWPWIVLRACWTMLVRRCEVILAVFPDDCFLLAGYVASLVTRKPLYVYFHNTYVENRDDSGLARWLQRRVFEKAKHVFVMSEGMERFYKTAYPRLSCSTLVHSSNEILPEPAAVAIPSPHSPLRLVLFGNINASNMDAAARICRLVRTTADVDLTLICGNDRTYLKKVGFEGERIRIVRFSDSLLESLRQADVVLLAHGFSGEISPVEIATIFPSRTIEALISQRPIVAHVPKDCFLAEYLRRHDCALVVDEPDVARLKQSIDRLRDDADLRRHLVLQALIAAQQFQASRVAAHLRRVIQDGMPRARGKIHTCISPTQ